MQFLDRHGIMDEYWDAPLPWWLRAWVWVVEAYYEAPVRFRDALRAAFWPKCDLCGNPAYFEHYGMAEGEGWHYVCWDCHFKPGHEGHGPVC